MEHSLRSHRQRRIPKSKSYKPNHDVHDKWSPDSSLPCSAPTPTQLPVIRKSRCWRTTISKNVRQRGIIHPPLSSQSMKKILPFLWSAHQNKIQTVPTTPSISQVILEKCTAVQSVLKPTAKTPTTITNLHDDMNDENILEHKLVCTNHTSSVNTVLKQDKWDWQ